MTSGTYFIQDCPTCGRSLRVRVEHLNRELSCQHCSGKLRACHPDDDVAPRQEDSLALLNRANELLDRTRIA
jgi:hypothetical protein